MNSLKLKRKLEEFFLEDIGEGDLTSNYIFDSSHTGKAVFLAKEDGVFAGADVIRSGYNLLNSAINVTVFKKDGEEITAGDKIAEVEGPTQTILTGERVILNLLQRMSGIATVTSKAVKLLQSSHTKICDTRKTSPGLRMFEKYAVACGGGCNHRMGLYDGIMIKDNHIAYCGSIEKAVERARSRAGHMVKIEVEVETLSQLQEAIEAKADIIMFDNRTPEEAKQFAEMTPSWIITEASGGIKLDNLESYSNTGVDYISLGFLTHSVQALDISLIVE
ncbi:carboxylating nicotinate-nucleotide diphosphorylase [Bacillus lacus]|uniref:Probable nicotinate-nucleotide pyrophosphorylase [carboxylating] n=1 Tax=Metabacillus lacus TaxID=1983721 RepID=A0A7X2LWE8_9BACI|nr:carboxylating nicotinate-nucleotide diphosphorylase [Metabacillus lacus]MRX71405.1 carboxylating nicotinate-nucleotide diphosphorylase [Metabacillus lacus]